MDTQLVGHQLANVIRSERKSEGRGDLAKILMLALGTYYQALKDKKIPIHPDAAQEQIAAFNVMFRLNPAENIPMDYVAELMGSVTFSKDSENDVAIAENIASNTYSSIEVLLDTIEGEIQLPAQKTKFARLRKKLPTNTFFGHLFLTHP